MTMVKRFSMALILCTLLALSGWTALAQDDDLGMADAVVSGDLNTACAVAVQEFFRTRDMSVLGQDVTFSDPDTMSIAQTGMTTEDAAAGGDAMATEEAVDTSGMMGTGMQPMLFDMAAFGDATYDVRSMFVTENAVIVEFTFSGTNTGDLMGQAATNAPVSLPAVAIFTCEGEMVTDVRVYYDRSSAMNQLGMASGGGMAGAGTADMATPTPEAGQMDAEATEAAADMAGAEATEAADDTAGAEATVVDVELTVEAVGATVNGDDTTDAEAMVTEAVEGAEGVAEDAAAGVAGAAGAVAAGDAAGMDPYGTLDAVTDDPEAYMGQTVTVAGPIRELVGGELGNGFVIVEEDLIGDDPALIVGANQDVLATGGWAVDQQVIVTGVVRGMAIAELEGEIGYDLNDELYAGYEGMPVIVASEVGPYDPNANVGQ